MEHYFRRLVEAGGGEIGFSVGRRPQLRAGGGWSTLEDEAPVSADASEALLELAPPGKREVFERSGDVCFACTVEDVGRFRVHVSRAIGGDLTVARHIPSETATLEELGLPEAAASLTSWRSGLVVVTGPKGAGKTTTLASMIARMARERAVQIVTIEDPIEFVHDVGQGVINQREVGVHAVDFAGALRAARIAGADVVLVGRIDDAGVAEEALRAAGSGCLVLAEMASATAVRAVRDLIALFPPARRVFARASLGACLRGILAQRLPARADGKGGAVAVESLLMSAVLETAIRDAGARGLEEAIRAGRRADVTFIDDALMGLVVSGRVETAEASAHASNEEEFRRRYASDHVESGQIPKEIPGDADPKRPARHTSTRVTRRLTRAEMFLVPMGIGAKKNGEGLKASFEAESETGEPRKEEGASLVNGLLADPNIVAGRRVLVVDDDDEVRNLLERMLRKAGARVTAVARPNEALDAISCGDYDMGIFDIMMPDVSGIELYDRAAETDPRLSEKVVFVTACNPDGQLTRRIAARGGMLVRKPFGIDDVLKGAAVALGADG